MGQISRSGKAGFARVTLTTLAALVPPEHEVVIHDARLGAPDYENNWDLVGFTGMTCEIPHVYAMADRFRAAGTRVAIGGYHASALPGEARRHADIVVVGEAETLWPQIIAECAAGDPRQTVYQCEEFTDMRRMVIPRRDLLDQTMYAMLNTLQATRGCPFNCEYCAVTKFFGRSYRCRPVAEVVDEIKRCPERRWMFLDDNLIANPEYAKKLFRKLIPLGITWGAQASIALARDPELLDLYAAAGGRYVFIGFESTSEDALVSMRKRFNKPGQYREDVRQLHRHGITVMGSFIFGLDEDDLGVFRRTVAFVDAARIDIPLYNVLTPLPGTTLHARMESEGRIHDRDWAHYDLCHSVIHPGKMTSIELQNGYYWAVRESYKLPHVLRRIIRSDPGWRSRMGASYTYRRKAFRYCPPPLQPAKYQTA
jgi:radical SAM superfamily enzyme YgiQ (UPF0313 family)